MKHMVSPETMWGSPLLCLVTQSRPTLCNLMDCSPPGSSVHRSSPGKNTAVSCHALLQGIFLTQGLNPGLPHCRRILYRLSHTGSPINEIEAKKTIEKMNKSWFFEKINKIDKPLARLTKKKRKRVQTNKMDNLEERDKFLERQNFPRLNQK